VTAFLFAPSAIELVLGELPSLAANLHDPAVEGTPSDAFPTLRKSELAIYRWLTGSHYDHLADALAMLDRVYGAGCTIGGLLGTRGRTQFEGHTGELLVAADLIRRGYSVTAVPRSAQASPDLHVAGDGIDVAVEVYSPRELIAVDDWVEEVKDLVMQVDLPADFDARIDTKVELPVTMPPIPRSDAWETADMIAATHEQVLEAIRAGVDEHLLELRPFSQTYEHPGTPLVTTVELSDVHATSDAGPARHGTLGWPGFGGYSPAGVFAKVVRRTTKKASERQAEGVEATACALVVNLTHTKIAEDLFHGGHLTDAAKALDGLEPADFGLDAIAFAARVLPHGLAALLIVTADEGALTEEQAQALFGHRPVES
jgi:hypothetical protein